MALNDTFNIIPIKIIKLGANLASNLTIKDYWVEK
tara:strand:- start:393 stop:497 length:105 start_codon:yes stop_codon:yes gene_type:complete